MALEPCPNCNKKISPNAAECPKCGHPLSEALWKKSRKQRKIHSLVGMVMIAGLVGYCVSNSDDGSSGSSSTSRTDRRCTDEIEALVFSQEFVRGRLRSPSTADFAGITDNGVQVTHLGDCKNLVLAYVDAQNGFGATVRNWYTTVMEYRRSEGNWYNLTSTLSISEARGQAMQTAAALRALYAKRDEPQAKVAPTFPPAFVTNIQSGLSKKGYDVGSIDGQMGPKTATAILAYEKANGMPETGEPSQVLLDHLNR